MRVKQDATFAEILSRFAEKNAIGELGDYEIAMKGSNSACNPLHKLSKYLQGVTCNLEIRKAALAIPSLGDAPKQNQFGSHLGSGRDNANCLVPKILIDFHSFLKDENRMKTEGLFRIAASSTVVDNILSEIEDEKIYQIGGKNQKWNAHAVATLIKKWFLCMPSRLFSSASDVQLRMCAEKTPERIYKLLDTPNSELLKWIVNLFSEISQNPEAKMDPFNLGLVMAPCVACEDNVSLASQVTLTKYAATIIEKCVQEKLKTNLPAKKPQRRAPPKRADTPARGLSCSTRSRGLIVTRPPSGKEFNSLNFSDFGEFESNDDGSSVDDNDDSSFVRSSSEGSLIKMM